MSEFKTINDVERLKRFKEVSNNTKRDAFTSFFAVMFRKKTTTIGFIIVVFFILLAIFGPMLIPKVTVDYRARLAMPSIKHWLGTDSSGRDTLAQFVLGARNVLTVSFLAAIFTVIIATIVGMTSGLLGGKADIVLMFVTNLVLTIPSFPVMMLLTTIIKIENPVLFGFVLAMWSWAGLARTIRSQILSVKQKDFIEAARILGMPNRHIIFNEMLPSITSYLAMNLIFTMRAAIAASVNLMMLGLVPFSANHWGMMILLATTTTGAVFGSSAIFYLLVPVTGIALFGMGCFFFAGGLDAALNPRLRSE